MKRKEMEFTYTAQEVILGVLGHNSDCGDTVNKPSIGMPRSICACGSPVSCGGSCGHRGGISFKKR